MNALWKRDVNRQSPTGPSVTWIVQHSSQDSGFRLHFLPFKQDTFILQGFTVYLHFALYLHKTGIFTSSSLQLTEWFSIASSWPWKFRLNWQKFCSSAPVELTLLCAVTQNLNSTPVVSDRDESREEKEAERESWKRRGSLQRRGIEYSTDELFCSLLLCYIWHRCSLRCSLVFSRKTRLFTAALAQLGQPTPPTWSQFLSRRCVTSGRIHPWIAFCGGFAPDVCDVTQCVRQLSSCILSKSCTHFLDFPSKQDNQIFS